MAAPIAHFDEDWPNEGELSLLSRLVVPQKGHCVPAGDAELEDELPDDGLSPSDCGAFRSMEDLVKDFDEKLSVCFQNYNAKTESIAPVNVLSEDTLLGRDEIWTALTQSYARVMPVDWKQSLTCSLNTPACNLEDQSCEKEVPIEVSDDEELREQLDMHSMIITSVTDEPLLTADQVIEEIEEMMQESPDAAHNPSQSDLSMLSMDVQRITSPHVFQAVSTRRPSYEFSEHLTTFELKIIINSNHQVRVLDLSTTSLVKRQILPPTSVLI